MRVPPVSPLKGSRRAFRVYRKEMEEEEMLREESAGRLTPRNDHPPTQLSFRAVARRS